MGLLDSLFNSDTYGGQQGGLLDFLKSLQPQGLALSPDMQPANFNPQQGQQNAQPSPLDNAQWPYGPIGAPSQAPAQMPPQQPPPVIQAQPSQVGSPLQANAQMLPQQQAQVAASGGFGDQLRNGLSGFIANAHTGPIGALLGGVAGGMGLQDPKSAHQQQIENLTARALLAKGVDPLDVQAAVKQPDLLKALVAKTYGPQTVQSLGSGYIADKNGKITRAYEPEDKIPSGFAKDENGKMGFIPGGPADPAYQRLLAAQKNDPNAVHVLGKDGELYKVDDKGNPTVVHKNESSTGLSDDALDIHARQEAQGDFSGRKNMGHGAQTGKAIEQIQNRTAEILTNEYHMTPAEAAAYMSKKYQDFNAQGIGLNAEARTSGVREGNLNLILKAADAAIPAALEASDKVNRTDFVPLNKVIQAGQVATSDPDLKKYAMANLQLAEHWARAMNPTGVMRESDRDMALSILGTADSKQTYKAAVQQLRTQIVRERDAVRSTRGMATLPGVAAPSSPADPLGIR